MLCSATIVNTGFSSFSASSSSLAIIRRRHRSVESGIKQNLLFGWECRDHLVDLAVVIVLPEGRAELVEIDCGIDDVERVRGRKAGRVYIECLSSRSA